MLLNYKVDPDIQDFRLLHPVITLYSPAKANFVKVYFSVVSIEVSKMSENTGKSHENKMVIIDCGDYDEYLRNAWFRGFREGYDMAMKFGLGCQQCYETGEKIACARAEECRKKIKVIKH